jgi:type III restriction enzyme
MKLELKGFQDAAVRKMCRDLDFACREARGGQSQALILSSPTGSGKTVTLAALMERILQGYEGQAAMPRATFLWISDSPELNQQSRDKLIRASTALRPNRLVLVDSSFDQEHFAQEHVYFLNTQKLGRDKLLTVRGDERSFTIWQTVANTIRERPDSFFLIIDEAHRGMDASAIERNRAQTIVQKFLLGDPDGGMPPASIVVGMSATPQRFHDLMAGSGRVPRITEIKPEDVRDSGLLKDRIVVYHPTQERPSDFTLLEAAAKQWKECRQHWDTYCRKEGEPLPVRPLLVVQVEDGHGKSLTNTKLDDVVTVIERTIGALSDENYAHAFDIAETITAGGRRIRKVEASRIQDEPFVDIIFFKMALSTGWDCPRAEVMMSFRRAVDPTSIAQLVGRMVRSPLARRIESNELLNSVALYLPHYDKKGLDRILAYLRDPQSPDALPATVITGAELVSYRRAAASEQAFKTLAKMPTYVIERGPKFGESKRLLMLGRYLSVLDNIDPDAQDEARDALLKPLAQQRSALYNSPDGAGRVRDAAEIRVKEISVESGIYRITDGTEMILTATAENIEQLFDSCDTMLAPKEGLHTAYWKKFYEPKKPMDAKLELVVMLQEPNLWSQIEAEAKKAFARLFDRNAKAIMALSPSHREKYRKLQGVAKEPQTFLITYPDVIQLPKKGEALKGHLYADAASRFYSELNSWEDRVLQAEMERKDFAFWLRNVDRQQWSLNIPCQVGGEWRGFYPDFLILRKVKSGLVIDILEPHDTTRTDALPKAKALAHYADQHGKCFGRILLIKYDGTRRKEIDLNKEEDRRRVIAAGDPVALEKLF